jgi:hypothetical protein
MQSSPVSNEHSSMSMWSTDSGSTPSLLGPRPYTVTPRIVMFRHSTGWMVQNGELRTLTSSMSTLSQS